MGRKTVDTVKELLAMFDGKIPMVEVNITDYLEATECYTGFCVGCKDFTTGQCEPDAEWYKCDDCGMSKVFGAEQSLILGLITLSDEEDE